QGHDLWIELRRSDVPVRVLAVLAGDERIELHGRDERVRARSPWRVLVQTGFQDPFVQVPIHPRVQPLPTLPVKRLVVRRKCSLAPRRVPNERDHAYIVTVSGRGYRFVAHVSTVTDRDFGKPAMLHVVEAAPTDPFATREVETGP